jgi:flagellar P-ring protein FlgI
MNKHTIVKIIAVIACVSFISTGIMVSPAYASVRIKDISSFQGVRDNQLIGYGLVVGLNGTGDKSQSVFTVKSIASLLMRLGVEVDPTRISPKNVAAVMITANLPPFVKTGSRIDIVLSSLGDASSLQGGTLLLTPLQGADGIVYAVAQGQVSIGGFESGKGGGGDKFATVARIPSGAVIEKEVPVLLVQENTLYLSLKNVDFTTCARVAEAINVTFGDQIALAQDGATVAILIPPAFQENLIKFLASIEKIEVVPDNSAKIIINERTGTIVGGQNVKISKVSITHKNINIEIKPAAQKTPSAPQEVEQETPSYLSMKEALFTEGQEKQEPAVATEETSIGEVAQILNSLGVKPQDMIAIFQAMKESGALQADMVLI